MLNVLSRDVVIGCTSNIVKQLLDLEEKKEEEEKKRRPVSIPTGYICRSWSHGYCPQREENHTKLMELSIRIIRSGVLKELQLDIGKIFIRMMKQYGASSEGHKESTA
jgi:hypothetical protein